MSGSKGLILTGKLGETMNESAKIALSYMRSAAEKFNLNFKDFDKTDLHIHFPAGAVPKDGPSAGITIATSIASLYLNKPVKHRLAMTGAISLLGQVLPIGGLKQKLIAAKQYGCREVIIPFENRKDLVEIPKEVTKDLKIHLVRNFEEVFRKVFVK